MHVTCTFGLRAYITHVHTYVPYYVELESVCYIYLATLFVRYPLLVAVFVGHFDASHAEPCLQRPRGVVDAGVKDTAVVTRLMECWREVEGGGGRGDKKRGGGGREEGRKRREENETKREADVNRGSIERGEKSVNKRNLTDIIFFLCNGNLHVGVPGGHLSSSG